MGPTEPVILKKINCVNFVTRPPRSPFGAARGSTCGNYWGGGGRGQTVVMLWKEILLAVSMTLVGSTGYTPSSSALTRSKAAKAWKQSGGILVCKSFLSAEEHRHVMEDANSLSSCLQPETKLNSHGSSSGQDFFFHVDSRNIQQPSSSIQVVVNSRRRIDSCNRFPNGTQGLPSGGKYAMALG